MIVLMPNRNKVSTYILINPETETPLKSERITRLESVERNLELWLDFKPERWVSAHYVPTYIALYDKGIRNHE